MSLSGYRGRPCATSFWYALDCGNNDRIFDRCGGHAFLQLPARNPPDDRNYSAGKCRRSLRTDDAKRSSLQNRASYWPLITRTPLTFEILDGPSFMKLVDWIRRGKIGRNNWINSGNPSGALVSAGHVHTANAPIRGCLKRCAPTVVISQKRRFAQAIGWRKRSRLR